MIIESNMESLPNEIWCNVFSHLDEKSVNSASLTCKSWFALIRNDPNFSGHICLKDHSLKEFLKKIEKAEWIWERWPALKTLELELDMSKGTSMYYVSICINCLSHHCKIIIDMLLEKVPLDGQLEEEVKEFAFISHQFKKNKKLRMLLELRSGEGQNGSLYEWQKLVNEKFQDIAKVEIVLEYTGYSVVRTNRLSILGCQEIV